MIQDMGNKLNIFVLFLALVSCNPLQKAQKRILANPEASERIFRELEKTRPCANDTRFITDIDTITEVEHFISKLPKFTFPSFAITPPKDTFIKKIKIREIKTGYIVDTRRLGIMADSLRFYKTSLDNATHTAYQYKKWLILAIIAILIYIIIKVKL